MGLAFSIRPASPRSARGTARVRAQLLASGRGSPMTDDVETTILGIDSGAEGVPVFGLRFLAHSCGPWCRVGGGHRRPARGPPPAGGGRPDRPRRQRAGALLPARGRRRLAWDPGVGRAGRRGGRRRGPRASASPSSSAGHEHQAVAAVRAQLRVLLRGPAAGRRARRRARPRPAGRGRRRVGEALRGQQPGDRAHAGQRRRRRAHPAGDLPAGLRAGGHRGPAVDRDVRLQQGQRRVRVRSTAGC